MSSPLLLCIAFQKEYLTAGREFEIVDVQKSLAVARELLDFARRNRWSVFHVKHIQPDAKVFAKDSPFSEFIEGFEPAVGERQFTKNDYSCFSSKVFRDELKRRREDPVAVIGFDSSKNCLATIVEGYHKGHQFNFVADASAAKKSGEQSEESLHAATSEILKSFCRVIESTEILKS